MKWALANFGLKKLLPPCDVPPNSISILICYTKVLYELFREVEEDYQGPHLIFTATDGPGCFSFTGRIDQQEGQNVNLGSPRCLHVDIILREILQALGMVIIYDQSNI